MFFDENLHLDDKKEKAVSHLCNTAWRAQTDKTAFPAAAGGTPDDGVFPKGAAAAISRNPTGRNLLCPRRIRGISSRRGCLQTLSRGRCRVRDRRVLHRKSSRRGRTYIAPFVFPCFLYSGLTKTGTALPRLSSKRTIL